MKKNLLFFIMLLSLCHSVFAWNYVTGSGYEFNAVDYMGKNTSSAYTFYAAGWGNEYGVWRIEKLGAQTSMVKVYNLRDFLDFKIDPANPTIALAGNWNGQLYKFENFAAVPTVTAVKAFGAPVYNIIFDPRANGKVLIAAINGTYRSVDYGATWSLVDASSPYRTEAVVEIEQSPWNEDEYYIAAIRNEEPDTTSGLYVYNFVQDKLIQLGLVGDDTVDLACDYDSNTTLVYVLTRQGKVFVYDGASFVQKTTVPGTTGLRKIDIVNAPCLSKMLYVCGDTAATKVYRSSDLGNTWQQYSTGLPGGVNKLVFSDDFSIAMSAGNYSGTGVYIDETCQSFYTATSTFTPTATATITDTPTVIRTFTFTPTYTATFTSTFTFTPTRTSTVIYTATITPEFTATQTPYDPVPRPTVEEGDSVPCPNVGKDSVKIVFNVNKKAQCRVYIYDFSGKLVDDYDITVGDTPNEKLYQLKIDTGKYVPGVYYYVIQGKDMEGNKIDFKSKKFMIKK